MRTSAGLRVAVLVAAVSLLATQNAPANASTGFESFSFPIRPLMARSSTSAYVFLNGTTSGDVPVYDAESGLQVGDCSLCGGGAGLARNPRNGDLAIGVWGGTVTVWHARGLTLTQYATLTMSSGYYCIGIAFDAAGNLYVADDPAATSLDLFSASTIARGGGPPDQTLSLPNLSSIDYLQNDDRGMLVSAWVPGWDSVGARLLTEGRLRGTARIFNDFGSLGGGGFAIDRQRNLIVSNGEDTLSVYAYPWTHTATRTVMLNGQSGGIALDPSEKLLWVTQWNIVGPHGIVISNAVALSYPGLRETGIRTPNVSNLVLDVAIAPVK